VGDDLSIVYQLRTVRWDGPIVKEGFVARPLTDWDPLEEGARHVKQHGHESARDLQVGPRASENQDRMNSSSPDQQT